MGREKALRTQKAKEIFGQELLWTKAEMEEQDPCCSTLPSRSDKPCGDDSGEFRLPGFKTIPPPVLQASVSSALTVLHQPKQQRGRPTWLTATGNRS